MLKHNIKGMKASLPQTQIFQSLHLFNLMFTLMTLDISNSEFCLKKNRVILQNQWFMPSGCKDTINRKFELVAKTLFILIQ